MRAHEVKGTESVRDEQISPCSEGEIIAVRAQHHDRCIVRGAAVGLDRHASHNRSARVGEIQKTIVKFQAIGAERGLRDRLHERIINDQDNHTGVHVQLPDYAGAGIGEKEDPSVSVQGYHSVEQDGVRKFGDLCDIRAVVEARGERGHIQSPYRARTLHRGGRVERVIGSYDIENVRMRLGDTEKTRGVGECVDESRVVGLQGIDLVQRGGAEDGGEDLAVGSNGEILDPGSGEESMDNVYRERKGRLRGSNVAGASIARSCRARKGRKQGEHSEPPAKTKSSHGRHEVCAVCKTVYFLRYICCLHN